MASQSKDRLPGLKQLRAWALADDLAVATFRLTRPFPRDCGWLASQMCWAAASVPTNIAEGYSLRSAREYLRHLSIARGSLAELEYFIHFTGRVELVDPAVLKKLDEQRKQTASILFLLMKAIHQKANTPATSSGIMEDKSLDHPDTPLEDASGL